MLTKLAERWANHPSILRASLVASFVAVCALVWPGVSDKELDHATLSYFSARDAGLLGPLSLHTAVMAPEGETDEWVAKGMVPWMSDPDATEARFRPLGGALFSALYQAVGREPVPWFVAMLALFLGLVAAVGALVRVALPASLAALAVLLFALDDIHSESFLFASGSMHVTPGAILGCLALVAHVRWRQGWKPGLLLSLGLWLLSFLTTELTLSWLAFLVAFEVVGFPSTERRLRALAPVAAMTLIYVVYKRAMGIGLVGVPQHIDPWTDPAGFAQWMWLNIRLVFQEAIVGSHAWGFWPVIAILAGTSPFLIAGVRSHPPGERRAILGILLGAVLSLAPVLDEPIDLDEWVSDRIMLMFSIGVALYWALVLRQAFRWARDAGPLHRRLVAGVAAVAVAGAVFVWSPRRLAGKVGTEGFGQLMSNMTRWGVEIYQEGMQVCGDDRDIVWLRNFMPFSAFGVTALYLHSEELRPTLVVSQSGSPLVLTRLATDRIKLEGEPLIDPTGFKMPEVGRRIAVPGAEIEVLAGDDAAVMAVEISFTRDPSRTCFVAVTETGGKRVVLPPVGQSVTVDSK